MHISEDKLLEFALEITDNESDRAEIDDHLETCPACRATLKKLQNDVEIISSVRPHRQVAVARARSRWRSALYPLLRAAALIVFGLAVGYSASVWLGDKPARVASQYATLASPADSVSRYAASDATDVSPGYYKRMLREIH